MARILLAWELGGNSGHAARLAAISRGLLDAGHHVTLAVQRPDAFRNARDLEGRVALRQAPVWPGLWRHGGADPLGEPASFGDVLANLGFTDSGSVEYLLRAWDGLLADCAPDALIADFAPLALLAARGHMPRMAVGTGFTVPPADGPCFPPFAPDARPLVAEPMLLDVINRALERLGRPQLARLPELIAAEAMLPGAFPLLDPYAGRRAEALLPPFLSGATPLQPGPPGNAVFAYLPGLRPESAAAAALARAAGAGLRVGLHAPGLSPSQADALSATGIGLLAHPLPPAEIVRQARLVVCAGGQGLVSLALAAGLPLAIAPANIEQRLTARALAATGLAHTVSAQTDLTALAADEALQQRARTAAPQFRAPAAAYESAVTARLAVLLA
ncbi:hypothetical protein [Novosphingobium cyanobacteriorum]|uniref:Glycosyl transferase family 28 C-terminal domain-containing protein n=1 Tax=Novosphingobium cyanobacteriorum TaxID=3024215 RepID=A0ABT6CLN2_9SPHN|nr:hypothetical protein [Novosphingobium cyanobacteriorum]MDF8334826.1 hypothetical protein [Novosphingobium cyanobacteriorum]